MRHRRRLRTASPQADYQRAKSEYESLSANIERVLNPQVKFIKGTLEKLGFDIEHIKNSIEDYDDMAWELIFEPSIQVVLANMNKATNALVRHVRSANSEYGDLSEELYEAEEDMENAEEELRSIRKTGPAALDHFELTE